MTTRREFLSHMAGASAIALTPDWWNTSRSTSLSQRRPPGVMQTVRGPIDASKLGFTLPHEHVFFE